MSTWTAYCSPITLFTSCQDLISLNIWIQGWVLFECGVLTLRDQSWQWKYRGHVLSVWSQISGASKTWGSLFSTVKTWTWWRFYWMVSVSGSNNSVLLLLSQWKKDHHHSDLLRWTPVVLWGCAVASCTNTFAIDPFSAEVTGTRPGVANQRIWIIPGRPVGFGGVLVSSHNTWWKYISRSADAVCGLPALAALFFSYAAIGYLSEGHRNK